MLKELGISNGQVVLFKGIAVVGEHKDIIELYKLPKENIYNYLSACAVKSAGYIYKLSEDKELYSEKDILSLILKYTKLEDKFNPNVDLNIIDDNLSEEEIINKLLKNGYFYKFKYVILKDILNDSVMKKIRLGK